MISLKVLKTGQLTCFASKEQCPFIHICGNHRTANRRQFYGATPQLNHVHLEEGNDIVQCHASVETCDEVGTPMYWGALILKNNSLDLLKPIKK